MGSRPMGDRVGFCLAMAWPLVKAPPLEERCCVVWRAAGVCPRADTCLEFIKIHFRQIFHIHVHSPRSPAFRHHREVKMSIAASEL